MGKYTHGCSKTPEYLAWGDMKQRCSNPNNRNYKNYGGRGITVCKRWLDSAGNFLIDMGPRPRHGSIDRIDNDGDYAPSNCRWVNNKEQQSNRRDNRRVVVDGQSKTIAQWAVGSGLSQHVITSRLKSGWPERDAVSMPVGVSRINQRWLELDGHQQTLVDWARQIDIHPSAITWRLKQGWSIRKTLTTKSTRSIPDYRRQRKSDG